MNAGTHYDRTQNIRSVIFCRPIEIFICLWYDRNRKKFAAIVSGVTGLPRWACVFNVVSLMLAISLLRIVGSFNIASSAAFLGLFITLCII
ncbi:MAG TPA: hypothetical protein DDY70_00585 [Clostridiales bacterium]|nr:hypothetical protein [Clostridiales bacterium]